MDSKSQLTVDVIAKVSEGKIDIVNAAKLLNKSRRTIERYLRRYREIGIQFVVHQNARKTPANKTCDKVKRQVLDQLNSPLKENIVEHPASEALVSNGQIVVPQGEPLRTYNGFGTPSGGLKFEPTVFDKKEKLYELISALNERVEENMPYLIKSVIAE